MKITIAQRYKPFSHQPGTKFLLPFSKLGFQIYPAYIRVLDAESASEMVLEEIFLDVSGPILDFTVEQDLEKGCLSVWGHTKIGYMRYRILPNEQEPKKFSIVVDKQPSPLFTSSYSTLETKSKIPSRLALGCSKSQDVDMIRRRLSMDEIFPLWYRLAQQIPTTEADSLQIGTTGTFSLLQDCQSAIASEEKNKILTAFKILFLAAFESGFCPRLEDKNHQGLCKKLSDADAATNPLAILKIGAQLIEGLFVKVQSQSVTLLPLLPTELHYGRMINISCDSLGKIDFEWTKKQIRQAIFSSATQQFITFIFPKNITRFRLRLNNEVDKGKWINSNTIGIDVKVDQLYLFDRFE